MKSLFRCFLPGDAHQPAPSSQVSGLPILNERLNQSDADVTNDQTFGSRQSPLELVRASGTVGERRAGPPAGRNRIVKSILHWTRRGHLYAGLLLIPWVFLYGVTGFLFNHSTFWPDQPVTHIRQSHTQGTAVASLPKAVEIAEEVVAVLNAQGSSQYRVVNPGSVTFTRGAFGAVVSGDGGERYTVQLFPNGSGIVRVAAATAKTGHEADGERGSQKRREAPPQGAGRSELDRGRTQGAGVNDQTIAAAETGRSSRTGTLERSGKLTAIKGPPFAVTQGLMLKFPIHEAIESGLPEVLRRLSLDHAQVSNILASTVKFKMTDAEKTWDVTYDPNSGAVSGIDVSESSGMSFRKFLLRLHTTHGYLPGDRSVRWLWVIMADATALTMMFWAVSGIVMWWQIKRTRLLGSVCLCISLLAAAYIGMGMHGFITSMVSP